MTRKTLYQVDWSGGQTDGDQTPNTVKQILNAEIEEFGRLRARDTLVFKWVSAYDGNNAYMSYNPASYYDADGWIAVITSTGLAMYTILDGVISTTHSFLKAGDLEDIDVMLSEISVYGDKFFLAAVDSSGAPLGAFVIFAPDTHDRFGAPHEIIGTEFDAGTSAEIGGKWDIQNIEMDVPMLSGHIMSTARNVGIGDQVSSNMSYRSNVESAKQIVIDAMGANSGLAVGVIAIHSFADNDTPLEEEIKISDGVYGYSPTISIKVQYVFHGDQVSRLSEGLNLVHGENLWSEDDTQPDKRFSIGYSIVLPNSLSPSVKGINLYRKIIDSDNPDISQDESYFYIGTAWVDDSAKKTDERISNTIMLTNYQDNSYDDASSPAGFIPHEIDSDGDSVAMASSAATRISSEGVMYRTEGWGSIGSGYLMWLHSHYGCDDAVVRMYVKSNNVDSEINYFSMKYDGRIASGRYGSGAYMHGTMLRFGADVIAYSIYTSEDGIIAYPISQSYHMRGVVGTYGAQFPPAFFAPIDLVISGHTASSIHAHTCYFDRLETDSYTKDLPFIMIRDDGGGTTDTEESLNGINSADLVQHKPLHISVAGGRMLCLGGIHDGSNKPTRAWYSQYQRFGMFNKDSFMDYGARDDGFGVALSSFRNTAVYHFSSATYIVDMSGGFDMSWRELGAYTSIGLAHNKAMCETPIGVFWGDKNDIYWFSGKSVEKISHIDSAKRTIRDTYRGMIRDGADRIRFNYRSDLRQVWVSHGAFVLVLDIDKMAWHEHLLSDLIQGLTEDIDVTSIIDINGTQHLTYSVYRDGSPVTNRMVSFDGVVDPKFEWGLKFDYDAGAPEIVKKSKRFYIYTDDVGTFTASVVGDDGNRIVQNLRSRGGMIRFSASVRGRAVEFDLKTKEDDRWRGMIDSIGMSHKLKPVK